MLIPQRAGTLQATEISLKGGIEMKGTYKIQFIVKPISRYLKIDSFFRNYDISNLLLIENLCHSYK